MRHARGVQPLGGRSASRVLEGAAGDHDRQSRVTAGDQVAAVTTVFQHHGGFTAEIDLLPRVEWHGQACFAAC